MNIQEYLSWAKQYPNELPTCMQYENLLHEFHMLNNMPYHTARSVVGMWTNKMWAEYLTKTNGKI
jgi:hypothetical protein